MKDFYIKFHRVPVYDLRFWVVVFNGSDSYKKARKKFEWAFGEDAVPPMGLVERSVDKFAIFMDAKFLSHGLISHEVFHATHRMLEFCSAPFQENFHEPFSYLNGYLTELVYCDIHRWGIDVRLRQPRVAEKYTRK